MTEDKALFLDTNMLVYASIDESPFHQAAKDAIQTAWQNERTLWISRQVLRKYLAVTTRSQNFNQPLSKEDIIKQIQFFQNTFNIADDIPEVTHHLLALLETYQIGGKQIHDANIVATMKTYGISNLLTYNVSDFRRFNDIIQIESI